MFLSFLFNKEVVQGKRLKIKKKKIFESKFELIEIVDNVKRIIDY